MSDGFKKVRPGEPVRVAASAWNRIIDQVVTKPRFDGEGSAWPETNFRVRCRNSTATGVARWGILQITGVLESPTGVGSQFEQWPGVVGVTPEGGVSAGAAYVVAVEPIPAGAIGRAAIDGVVQCKLDIQDAGHKYATIKDGSSSELKTASSGEASILWKEDGTGTDKWGLVRLGPNAGGGVKIGKITGTWTKDGTQTVWEFTGTGVQATGPSGPLSLTGVNRFVTVNVTGSAEKWVAVAAVDSTWHLIAAECS